MHILESSMRHLVFRKISIAVVNELQFLETTCKSDLSEASNQKQDHIILIFSVINLGSYI